MILQLHGQWKNTAFPELDVSEGTRTMGKHPVVVVCTKGVKYMSQIRLFHVASQPCGYFQYVKVRFPTGLTG